MNKNILIIFLFIILASACSTETEIKKSVFIPDKEFPGLPAYSEWGYNTFGAYYDRAPFVSMDFAVPSKVEVTPEEVLFTLEGERKLGSNTNQLVEIQFVLPGVTFETYNNLIELHQQTYDLTQLTVRIATDVNVSEVIISEGNLEFVRAQNLWVDRRQTEVILSGRFNFKGTMDGEPITISEGRFDLGISDDNFYNFN
jgi:hypothetical protein